MVMYISKAIESNIGARMHYQAIKEIAGEENVFTIILSPDCEYAKREHYISYGKYKDPMERIQRWLQGNMMFISNDIINEICEIIASHKIETVFIEDSVFGNLVKKIKCKFSSIRVISFYHDIKGILYMRWIKTAKLKDKVEYYIGIRQEYVNQKYCDINLVFNQRDADVFQSLYGKKVEGTIALPAPMQKITDEYKNSISPKQEKKTLLFVGKKYAPNINGLMWLYKEVLPALEDNFELQIVGRGLEYLKDELMDVRVSVIGGVDNLDLFYKKADIVIAPVFEGGGMKSKTVEAISFGKKFVGTEESLFGFWEEMNENIRNIDVYQCNTAKEWIFTLNGLLNQEIKKFNAREFELFVSKFSYEAIREQMQKKLDIKEI